MEGVWVEVEAEDTEGVVNMEGLEETETGRTSEGELTTMLVSRVAVVGGALSSASVMSFMRAIASIIFLARPYSHKYTRMCKHCGDRARHSPNVMDN